MNVERHICLVGVLYRYFQSFLVERERERERQTEEETNGNRRRLHSTASIYMLSKREGERERKGQRWGRKQKLLTHPLKPTHKMLESGRKGRKRTRIRESELGRVREQTNRDIQKMFSIVNCLGLLKALNCDAFNRTPTWKVFQTDFGLPKIIISRKREAKINKLYIQFDQPKQSKSIPNFIFRPLSLINFDNLFLATLSISLFVSLSKSQNSWRAHEGITNFYFTMKENKLGLIYWLEQR